METLKIVASVLGSISTIITFAVLVNKRFRNWICRKVAAKVAAKEKQIKDEQTNTLILEEVKALSEAFKALQNEKVMEKEALKCILRHSITVIYETHKKEKCFPEYIKKDMIYMCEAYFKLGGNSYIETIYEEMLKWDTNS